MLPAFSASCSELIGRWENAVAASVGKAELDIWPDFQNLSGDVISRAAFGVRHHEGRQIFLLQAEQAERLVQSFRSNYIPGLSYGSHHCPNIFSFSPRFLFSTHLLDYTSSVSYYYIRLSSIAHIHIDVNARKPYNLKEVVIYNWIICFTLLKMLLINFLLLHC
jgi:hypothetical protein